MRISQSLPKFLQWLQFNRNDTPETINHYKRILRKFIKDIGDLKVGRISIETIWQWKEILSTRNLELRTQRKYLMSLKVFLKFCQQERLVKIDLGQVTLPKISFKEVIYLENGEVQKFTETIKNLQFRTIVEVLLGTGMRISELLSLKRGDIQNGEVKIIGKGGGERVVFFSDRALFWLSKYLKRNKTNPMLFGLSRPIVEGFFVKHRQQLGWQKKITPHTCRHTLATNLVNHGADISFIKDLLGQKDIKTTAQYYLGTNKKKLKEVHRKYLNYNE